MPLTTWKKSTLDRPGTAQQFGSRDLNRVSDLLNGEDVGPVEINTDWHWVRAPSGIEVPAGYISDAHVNGSAAIAYAKLSLADSITDTDIFGHTSTKISITNRAQLPADLVYEDQEQHLSKKLIHASDNQIPEVVQSPLVRRTGSAYPGASAIRREGILADHTNGTVGTVSNLWDGNVEGLVTSLPTTVAAGVQAGIVSPTTGVGLTRRAFETLLIARIKVSATATTRFWIGYTSAATLPIADAPLGAADHGAIIGFNDSDGQFTVRTNDGTAGVNTQVIGGARALAKDANYHTVEMYWGGTSDPSGIWIEIDGGTPQAANSWIATKLPGINTNLFFNCVAQTSGAAARTIFVKGVWLEVTV